MEQFRFLYFLRKNSDALLYIIICTGFVISSCRKVINVDIPDAKKKYVIEGVIADQPGESRVLLSTTLNMSETKPFPGVSGAVVSVRDDVGNSTRFTEDSAGIYKAPGFTGIIGRTYFLDVMVAGENFTAESTMPPVVKMDSLYITDEVLFGSSRKLANATYQDPPGKGEAYRYVQYINGEKGKTIFVNNDDYTDGKYVEAKLWYISEDSSDDRKIEKGDTVTLDLLCIAAPVYRYWFSLNQSATGNSQSASPANAVTNIRGGALGYFSAHNLQRKTVVAR